MKEEWKDVKGYEGIYEISNLGNVKSFYSGKIISQKKNNRGYMVVDLYKNRQRKSFLVHRIVAISFLNKDKLCNDVNHIDENKENNCVENLEWCTHKENVNKWCKNNTEKVGRKQFKSTEKYRKLDMNISMFNKDGSFIKTYTRASDIKKELNKDISCIIQCCDGKRKSAYGYKWKFAFE